MRYVSSKGSALSKSKPKQTKEEQIPKIYYNEQKIIKYITRAKRLEKESDEERRG